MLGNELPFFKFVTELIDAGIWAKMSPTARTLYPVLLRFTDRNFSPVYPGTKRLLELTGFKQKASLRQARKELIELGLISVTIGKGRSNTIYHFRFDWAKKGYKNPSEGDSHTPQRDYLTPLNREKGYPSNSHPVPPPYNQIQISIHNQPNSREIQESQDDPLAELRKIFGSRNVDLAISEAKLADLKPDYETINKILSNSSFSKKISYHELISELEKKISQNSLNLIKNSFVTEKEGYIIFDESIPVYLKNILLKFSNFILFEPVATSSNLSKSREIWRKYE